MGKISENFWLAAGASVLVCVTALAAPPGALAATVSFAFTGTVTETQGNIVPSGFNIGDPVAGTITYDSDVPDNPVFSGGQYSDAALMQLSLEIDGNAYSMVGGEVSTLDIATLDRWSIASDFSSVFTGPFLEDTTSAVVNFYDLDSPFDLLSSIALAAGYPPFVISEVSTDPDGTTSYGQLRTDGNDEHGGGTFWQVRYRIDTVSPVPDLSTVPVPAALPLFLSGLIGLGVAARRHCKTKT